jgi:hypothetical protein
MILRSDGRVCLGNIVNALEAELRIGHLLFGLWEWQQRYFEAIQFL